MNNFEKEIHNDEKNFHSFVFYQNNRNFANAFCIYIHLMNSIKPARRGIRAHQDPKIKLASIDQLMIKDDYKMF